MKPALFLTLLLLPTTLLGETPTSIIGTWHLDLVKTIGISQPDDLATLLEQVKAAVTIVFTEDSLTVNSANQPPMKGRYTIFGGSSTELDFEFINQLGQKYISKIRLIDGGIAVDSMDCDTYWLLCIKADFETKTLITTTDETALVALEDKKPVQVRYPTSSLDGAVQRPDPKSMRTTYWYRATD